MEVIRHEAIENDLRNLKKFAAPRESLEAWERLFCSKGLLETPAIDPYPGFGQAKIYKARVVPLHENVGKSKGYRIVLEAVDQGLCKILVFSRHGIYKEEQELIDWVSERLK